VNAPIRSHVRKDRHGGTWVARTRTLHASGISLSFREFCETWESAMRAAERQRAEAAQKEWIGRWRTADDSRNSRATEPPVGATAWFDGYLWARGPSGNWTRIDIRGRAVGEPKTWAELTGAEEATP
jgi:hypothetical protein